MSRHRIETILAEDREAADGKDRFSDIPLYPSATRALWGRFDELVEPRLAQLDLEPLLLRRALGMRESNDRTGAERGLPPRDHLPAVDELRRWVQELRGSRSVIHDLRHGHASQLIGAGWDAVEVAKRLGDRVDTVLRVYAHEFDARRRSEERREALEAMYGERSALRRVK